ncbi:radical SAM protein [Amycolatopsis sp. NPDC051102]|uniref:radical SAM protein n=1 Tax=Amycolatopsis sp. NPDC051102 TaxID=3155163 RepID=UPI00342DDCDC
MTELGMPTVMSRSSAPSGPVVFTRGHHFQLNGSTSVDDLVGSLHAPLSVILQVTKRCDFDCDFCSEILQLPDPTLDQLDTMRTNLAGVKRVFLSGGEPLMRRDFGDVVDMYSDDFILGIPTNATRALQHAKRLAGKVAYVNVGLEGPRSITQRVRGDYDKVMAGIRVFQEHGLPLSLSCVVLRSDLHGLPFTYQIADTLDAGKLKLIMPLRKGNALDLDEHEFISNTEAEAKFNELVGLASTFAWRPALRLTAWTPETEGHMICIEPTGKANAWPVYDAPDLFEPLGNVLEEPVSEIWNRYRFKRNHVSKYLGTSIHTTLRGGSDA